ncbi:MAG: DUF484 family protein [Gammaproteobacteria bacterium]|nr:DUF484 family protein [Gammaproteobacteria bacterium]
MTKASKSAAAAGPTAPDDAQVVGFLKARPDFLRQHPDVLAALDLAHEVDGSAVSLIERQTRVLRERNAALQVQVDEQLDAARYNEQLHARLHALCLNLFPATTFEARVAVVRQHMAELGGDALSLRLYGDSEATPEAYRADREHLDFQRQFGTFLRSRAPLCGRLQKGQLEYLFGAQGKDVKSAALTPLGRDGAVGLLAIGSHDVERFQPHLGTDFLRQLGETIGEALTATLPV